MSNATVTPISLPHNISPSMLLAMERNPGFSRQSMLPRTQPPTLENFDALNNKPWMIIDDFNATLARGERSSSSVGSNRSTQAFREWFDDFNIIEWFLRRSATTRYDHFKGAGLYRAICNQSWCLRFLDAKVRHLSSPHSDHLPLLINLNHITTQPILSRSFRFQAAWFSHKNFGAFLASTWRFDLCLCESLKLLASDLSIWNKQIFARKRNLWRQLEQVQGRFSNKPLRNALLLEQTLKIKLEEVLHQEQLLWFQKSRVAFLVDGNRNTRFYHLTTVIRRRLNKIPSLQNENED
ncbi:hypothetical protein V2J09_015477 [Rumex salicifolius]